MNRDITPDLGHEPNDFKRDDRDGVYVKAVDGRLATRGKNKGEVAWDRYRRTSSLGDVKHDQLVKHLLRFVARGMTLIDLPLPHGPEEKTFWNNVVDLAEEAAGGNTAADIGTHIHEQCARASVHWIKTGTEDWRGLIEGNPDLGITRDTTIQAVEAFRALCRETQLEPVKVEATIVNDRLKAAGTFDYLMLHVPTGRHHIADIKGSTSIRPNYACQMYGYASGQPYRTSDDTRLDWPAPVDQDVGYIFQFDRNMLTEEGETTWTLHEVNLQEGARLLERVDALWEDIDRDAYDQYFATVTTLPESEEPPVEAPQSDAQPHPPHQVIVDSDQPFVDDISPDWDTPPAEAAAARFGALDETERQQVRDARKARGIADDDYPAILALIDEFDPFNIDAGTGDLDRFVAAPATTITNNPPDEGPPADPADVRLLQEKFKGLPDEYRDALRAITAKVKNLSVAQNPSVRRFNLGAALLQLVSFLDGDPSELGKMITAVEWFTNLSFEYASAEESAILLNTVTALCENDPSFALHIDQDGAYRLVKS